MMTSLILASGGEDSTKNMPLDGSLGPLFPTNYDVVWSLVCFLIIMLSVSYTHLTLPTILRV